MRNINFKLEDHEIRQMWFSTPKEKVKPVCVLNWKEQNSDLTAFNFKIQVFCSAAWTKGGPHENEFWQFSNTKKWLSQTAQKVDRKNKNGVICLVSFFPSWVMVLKLPKIVHFLQICTDFSKESKFIKAIYLYPPEGPIMHIQKIVCFIGVCATVHEIPRNKISTKVLTQQKSNKIHQLQKLISSKF